MGWVRDSIIYDKWKVFKFEIIRNYLQFAIFASHLCTKNLFSAKMGCMVKAKLASKGTTWFHDGKNKSTIPVGSLSFLSSTCSSVMHQDPLSHTHSFRMLYFLLTFEFTWWWKKLKKCWSQTKKELQGVWKSYLIKRLF
jgi:hypothetical protein